MTIYEGDDSTINNDWDESGSTSMKVKETIVLSDYTTKEEMHALMIEKGFRLKSNEEIAAMKLRKENEAREEEEQRMKRREEGKKQREENRRRRIEEKEMNHARKVDIEFERTKQQAVSSNDGEL